MTGVKWNSLLSVEVMPKQPELRLKVVPTHGVFKLTFSTTSNSFNFHKIFLQKLSTSVLKVTKRHLLMTNHTELKSTFKTVSADSLTLITFTFSYLCYMNSDTISLIIYTLFSPILYWISQYNLHFLLFLCLLHCFIIIVIGNVDVKCALIL